MYVGPFIYHAINFGGGGGVSHYIAQLHGQGGGSTEGAYFVPRHTTLNRLHLLETFELI